MNYNEYVQDFLDGSLAGTEENEFFLALSSSEELRREFKQQLSIKDAIRADIKAFTPKAKTTAMIFNSLGLTPPGTMIPPKLGVTQRIYNFIKPYIQAIYGGFAAAAATIAIMLLLFKPFGNGGNIRNENGAELAKKYQETSSIPLLPDSSCRQMPFVSSFENKDEKKIDKNELKPQTKIKYFYLDKNNSQFNNNFSNDETAGLIDEDKINKNVKPHDFSSVLEKDNIIIENHLLTSKIKNDFPTINLGVLPEHNALIPFKINEEIDFSVEFRGLQDWFFTNENIQPEKYQKFNNISIAMFYELFDELLLGFEYRRENFYQKYEGISDLGYINLYEQQPNFSSYSAVARYLPKYASFSFFNPFLQLSLGGTKAGYIGRSMLGTEISPYSNMSFTIGAEAGLLRFHHEQYYFYSPKYGLCFGVRVNL